MLSEKYNMHYFSGDDNRFHFYKMADTSKHKYMTMDTTDFWNWSLEEMIAWEKGVISEQTPLILEELNELANQHDFVLFEGMLDMDYLKKMIPTQQIVYLTVNRESCEKVFFERFDHSAMVEAILNEKGVPDDEKDRRIKIRRSAAINAFYEKADDYGLKSFSRDYMKSPIEMLTLVEDYFCLK